MKADRIAVILPCYREAEVFSDTIRPLLAAGYQVIVVDDGSDDGTDLLATNSPVTYLKHAINLGQGAALQTGMDYALLHTDAAYIVHFDADGQHDPAEIPALVEALSQSRGDVVLGSRFLRPEHARQVPRLRALLLKAARWLNWAMTGLLLSDAHNGLRAMTREAAQKIHLKENRQAHASELLWLIRKAKLRVCEHPTSIAYTPYSLRKGQKLNNSLDILIDLLLQRLMR